ncbi:hypothetical protein LX36DRAFT_740041 [Colletotrichum falcatum]|nr:hypothetical protein LX36DRAFT_740041 [Colletotrichum falcatum]
MSSGTSSRELPGWRARNPGPGDATTPHCTRCAKAGRPCEGYPDSDPPALSGKPRGLVRLVSHPAAAGGRGADVRILATPAHEAALFRHQKQWDLFHAFVLSHEQGDTILRDGMGLAMLQRTHAEAALREMCCGIGALTNALRHVRDPGAMGAEYGQALEHYGRAVRAVYRAPGGATAHNLMVAIMASVLFVAFDIISGDAAAAAAHHGHAVAMMEQYVDVRIERERGLLPLGALPFSQLESDMFMWLLRHDTHPWALGFGRESLRTIAPARRFPRCRHRHEMRDVPPVFDDVPQATSWWHVAQHAVLHCLHDIKIRTRPKPEGTPEAEEGVGGLRGGGGSGSGSGGDDDDDMPRLWAECVRILRTWRASFAPLLQAAQRQRDRNYRRWFKAMALETLYIETLSAVDARAVSASGGGGGGGDTDEETPPPPPPVSPLYLEIIRHAVRLAATRPFNGAETLADENDLVRPLVAVQYKTRDPAVRRELAAALRRLGGGTGLAESLLFMGECRERGAPVAAIERGWAHAVTSSGMTAGAELLDYLD